jgi:ATP adenylyltransferase
MKILYAPWREKYITPNAKRVSSHNSTECPFCIQLGENKDEEHFIIKRYTRVFLCMNKYPYNEGHLLVIPFEHQADISSLSSETAQEIMIVTQEAVSALKRVCNPIAFNIGMNMGKESGGSIPAHLHLHILPRFSGDTNFLSVLAETKLISVNILPVYEQLKKILL